MAQSCIRCTHTPLVDCPCPCHEQEALDIDECDIERVYGEGYTTQRTFFENPYHGTQGEEIWEEGYIRHALTDALEQKMIVAPEEEPFSRAVSWSYLKAMNQY
ncbi:MAG: hypothetical protein IT564_11395 [Rhodospirillales bacterium]|nr:hypothetical protein [Rhodospirillales bacterium]